VHTRTILATFVSIAALSFWPAAASAAESLFPFEDHATHLWGYENARGAVVITPQFSVAGDFSSQGIAAVADESGWKYIDRKGTILIRPFVFDNGPDPFQEGLARFKEAGRFGFFDESGGVVISPRFDFAAPFSDGLAAFRQGCREHSQGEHSSYEGGKWGFIDRRGIVVVPPQFEKARPFAQGKASVMLNGRWVTIDKNGGLS
jgi:hypothetical protein